MINTSQSNFGDLNLDDGCIRDIADVITAEAADYADLPAQEAASNYEEEEEEEESEQPVEETKEWKVIKKRLSKDLVGEEG